MTTLSERISQSAFDGSRLRVVLLLDLYDGAQKQFLEAYEHLRNQVASVPGHISDQLCQSIENPSQWLITSEWESAPPFLAWVNSEEHVETVQPLHNCVRDTRSLRYSVLRETGRGFAAVPGVTKGGLQTAPRLGDGVVRHALTFTVKPGREDKVAKILAGYTSPAARVDESTRLRRTSLFMHGNRVVRAIEVEGDLLAALRHVARQPEVREVEEAINPYLEQDRDLNDPDSARMFFTRAALPAVHHVSADGPVPSDVHRHALYYPAKEGCGMTLARLLAKQDVAAADGAGSPVHSSTIFQRDDIVVRLIDVSGPLTAKPALALGVNGPRKAATLARLLAPGQKGAMPTTDEGISRFLDQYDMDPITDRSASPDSPDSPES
ncbi:SchA/CurD-like domain-containing protein [Streptomyces sp. NPDC052236]|uniref:SchA/CurD-like domain-containing protein n=1 Tax=Streptomyces sp. NPDC052236 TaxID=3365686 RepID=UPI0037D0F21E